MASTNNSAREIKPFDRSEVKLSFMINGERETVSFAPYKTLLEALSEDLGLSSTSTAMNWASASF